MKKTLAEDVQHASTQDSPKRRIASKCEGDTSFIIMNSHETFLCSTYRLSRVLTLNCCSSINVSELVYKFRIFLSLKSRNKEN